MSDESLMMFLTRSSLIRGEGECEEGGRGGWARDSGGEWDGILPLVWARRVGRLPATEVACTRLGTEWGNEEVNEGEMLDMLAMMEWAAETPACGSGPVPLALITAAAAALAVEENPPRAGTKGV